MFCSNKLQHPSRMLIKAQAASQETGLQFNPAQKTQTAIIPTQILQIMRNMTNDSSFPAKVQDGYSRLTNAKAPNDSADEHPMNECPTISRAIKA